MKNKFSFLFATLFLISSASFAETPVANKTLNTLELPHSALTLGEQATWIRKWEMNKFTGTSLKSITSFDENILLTFSGPDYVYLNQQKATSFKAIGNDQYVWEFSDANVDYKRTYQVDGEAVDVSVAVSFKQKMPAQAFLSLVTQGAKEDTESRDRELFYFTDSKIERKNVDKGIDGNTITTPVKWVGAGIRHFILAVIPEGITPEKVLLQSTGQYNGQVSLQFPVTNNTFNAKFKIAFVPKQLDILRSVDKSLDTTVNLGFFTFLAYPILWALKFIYGFVHNYGVAIIILTIFIKILTFPLVLKSMKGMRKMAEFQPKMKALQEKHKDNKVALNQEMMVMMKSSGYNPMAGCLPMLIQMPIFFALYSVLWAAVELNHEPFYFWIHDLSAKDPYYATPILMALIMFLQQKVTPPSPGMDATQRKVMMFMPLIFGLFMVNTPAGLCLYMVVNATVSILIQQYLNKKLGIPGQAANMATSF